MRRSTDGYSAVHLCPGCGNCMRWAGAEYACAEDRCPSSMNPGYCRCPRPVGPGDPPERCRRVLRVIPGGAFRCTNGCSSEVRQPQRVVTTPPEPVAHVPVRSMMADKTRARRIATCPRCENMNQCVVFQHPRNFYLCLGCPACEFTWNPALEPAVSDAFERAAPVPPAPSEPRAASAPVRITGRVDVETMRIKIERR